MPQEYLRRVRQGWSQVVSYPEGLQFRRSRSTQLSNLRGAPSPMTNARIFGLGAQNPNI